MIDKFVIDPQKDRDQTTVELAQSLNEVIDAVNRPILRTAPPVPGPAQHVAFIETMVQRLQTGPFKLLSEAAPSDSTKALGEALSTLQDAVAVYKKSLEE